MVSPLRARSTVLRSTTSGVKATRALLTMLALTASAWPLPRGASRAAPALTFTCGGMWLSVRKASSLMPTSRAASATLMVRGATHTVWLASGALGSMAARFCLKVAAFSQGSRMCSAAWAKMTERFMPGLRARKSSSRTPASSAARATSMSRVMATVSKKGWLPMSGSEASNLPGSAMMFLTACSLGT